MAHYRLHYTFGNNEMPLVPSKATQQLQQIPAHTEAPVNAFIYRDDDKSFLPFVDGPRLFCDVKSPVRSLHHMCV